MVKNEHTVHLRVEGMMCQRNCGTTVTNALLALPNATHAESSFLHSYAAVTLSVDKSDAFRSTNELEKEAVDAIECVGFDAHVLSSLEMESLLLHLNHTVHLKVEGMMCQKNCGTTVESALRQRFASKENNVVVSNVKAVFAQSYAQVTCSFLQQDDNNDHDDGSTSLLMRIAKLERDAIDAVECVGFDAAILSDYELDDYLESQSSSNNKSHCDEGVDDPIPLELQEGGNNTATLSVKGMSCAVCVGRVEGMLKQVQGVTNASVALTTHRAQIQVDDSSQLYSTKTVAETCVDVINKGGYECSLLQVGSSGGSQGISLADSAAQMQDSRDHEMRTWRSLLITSTFLTVPLIILHSHQFQCLLNVGIPFCQASIELFLATIVQFVVGKRYYMAAWKGWTNGRFMGMDFLVVMGTSAAYLFSVMTYIGHLYEHQETNMKEAAFETAAMLFTFVTLGKFLESYAKGKTASALQTLMELQPIMALKITNMKPEEDASVDISSLQTEEISAKDIRVGDYLYVLPGSRIPSDGVLIATSDLTPHAYVDESALSGEPFPVAKPVGGKVFGATVNQLATLVVRVTAAGNSTVLAKIVQLMENAQSQKAPIEAQADKVACIFAPTVMVLSALTFLAWVIFYDNPNRLHLAIMSAISVIVVACPCALGLATPTAVMVGTGVGATHGLLIKGGAVLEGAHGIDTVIFDKTGTLTTGKAVVQEHVQFVSNKHDIVRRRPSVVKENQVCLWLAACAEKQSEHPLAKAIVNTARSEWGADVTCSSEGFQVKDFQLVPGSGVECVVMGKGASWNVRVGNRSWAVDTDDAHKACEGDIEVNELRARGQVGIYVGVTSEANRQVDSSSPRSVVGVIGIADPIQKEAPSTVAALQRMGVDVWMCTGDHEITAHAVARQVGIPEENVCAGVKPEGKADLVTRLQKKDRGGNSTRRGKRERRHQKGRLGFVGDGINDAVALARADVGIAIGAGTEVAVEAADVVLVRSSLHDVVIALHLSRVVFRRIRLNFVWALGYNLVALPFAAGVFFPFTNFRLPPQFAGLMMAFSSVSVVTSSLLLRTYSRPTIRSDGSFRYSGCFSRFWNRCEEESATSACCHSRPHYENVPLDSDSDEGMHFNSNLEIV